MTKERDRAAVTSTAASERVELKGLFTMMLGVWYPQNYILAAIDPREGAAAVKALLAYAAAARRGLSQPRSDRRRIDERITDLT